MTLNEFLKEVGQKESDIFRYKTKEKALEAVNQYGNALQFVRSKRQRYA